MTISLEIVIAIGSICWTTGLFVGLLTSRFVSRKDCAEAKDQLWKRVDALQDAMTGGPYTFSVRLIPNVGNET